MSVRVRVCPLRPRVDLSSFQLSSPLAVTTEHIFIAITGGRRGRGGVPLLVSQRTRRKRVSARGAAEGQIDQRCLIRREKAGSHFPLQTRGNPATCRLDAIHPQADLCTRTNTLTTGADCRNDSNRANPMTDNRIALWPRADREGNRQTDFQVSLKVSFFSSPQLKVLVC